MVKSNKISKIVVNIGSTKSVAAAKKQIEEIENRYANAQTMLDKFSQELERKYMKPMLRQLRREEPPKRRYPDDYPIEFTSDAQRKKVMMLLDGKPYPRSHALQQGWYYKVKKSGKKVTITVGNEKPYSRFVVGKFGLGRSSRQKRRYVEMQQKFHRVTGWTPAYITIQKHLSKAKNAGTTFIQQWINEGKV